MNQHPVMIFDPVFRWLDWLISEHGLYIYLVAVWLSPFLIEWILSGGFWRRPLRRRRIRKLPPVIQIATPPPPPLPPTPREVESQMTRTSDEDIRFFGA